MLTIKMLGKGAIYNKEECISDKLSSKLMALIFLLVLNKDKDLSKEKIISYLWPDSNDEAAKSNLRFNLWSIKKIIPPGRDGEEFILSGKDYCRINGQYPYDCDRTRLDAVKVSQLKSAEELLELKELFRGDFLEGLYLRNCNDFNEMILFERVVCQTKQVEVLEKLIDLYDEQEQYEEELKIINEVTAIEPYNEKFAYRAIQIYGKTGNRTAAINYYKNFEIVLRRNLNTAPDSELKLLYQELMESSCSFKYEPKSRGRCARQQLDLNVYGLKGIEYFGIAGMLEGILEQTDKKYIHEMDSSDLADLAYISAGLKKELERLNPNERHGTVFVPASRIVMSFLNVLKHIARRYEVRLIVTGLEEMDSVSRNLICYLEKIKYEKHRNPI